MSPHLEYDLTITPSSRYDVIDVSRLVPAGPRRRLADAPKVVCCSYHTTAGYLDQGILGRLDHRRERLDRFMGAFRHLFPEGAGYSHDELERRHELSEDQRAVEPKNADSHLAAIGAGLRNCVTYTRHGDRPLYFIDLDGVNGETARTRRTRLIAYERDEVVARATHLVPVSPHPVDSVNLRDPATGLPAVLERLLAEHPIEAGRIDLVLSPEESDAGLTVNEFETLLMRDDLAAALRDPLRYAATAGRRILRHPRTFASKSLGYAKYDLVHLFNETMEAFHLDRSTVERVLSQLLAVPASRFLRVKRVASLLVAEGDGGPGRLLHGRYQSPILVQWRSSPRDARRVEITLRRFV